MIKRRRTDRSDAPPADQEPSLELPSDDRADERAHDRGDESTDPREPASTPAGAGPSERPAEPEPPIETAEARPGDQPDAGDRPPPVANEAGDDARAGTHAGGSGAGTPDSAAGGAPPPERRHRGGWLAALALLLALAAAAAAGWTGWRMMALERQLATIPADRAAALEPLASEQAALARQLDGLAGELERRIEQRIGALEQRLTRVEDERTAALERMRQRVQTAETAIQSLREQGERTGADWRMAEVRYLVSMAANRLRITGDVPGGIAALQAADSALARMGDPRVLDLRERLVERIGELEQIEPADVAGIALRVQNLAPRIPGLVRAGAGPAQRAADGAGDAGDTGDAGDSGGGGGDEGWWAAIRGQLGELVSVRREPAPAPPDAAARPIGPVPSAELPAAERLLLALEDASRAALSHDPRAYDEALGRALTLVESEYDPNAPANQRFLEALSALRERRVTTDLPDLGPLVERTEALATRLSGSGAPAQGGN